jgi:hypothetical protein
MHVLSRGVLLYFHHFERDDTLPYRLVLDDGRKRV